jgi:hypothetical protein
MVEEAVLGYVSYELSISVSFTGTNFKRMPLCGSRRQASKGEYEQNRDANYKQRTQKYNVVILGN